MYSPLIPIIVNSFSILFCLLSIYHWHSGKKRINSIKEQQEEYYRLRNIELEKLVSEATGARHAIIALYKTLSKDSE